MPRQNVLQASWAKGEISPLTRGRADANLYQTGAQTIENLIVRPQGPLFRRSGTKFVRSTKFPSQRARIIPFTVSDTTTYELEFGAGYIHFYKNKEPLFETTTTEVESWYAETSADGSGLLTAIADTTGTTRPNKLPGWGDITTFYPATAINGDIAITDNGGGVVRLTTTVPHTLRTGVYVCVRSTELTSIDGTELAITGTANNGSGAVRVTIVGHPYITGNLVAIQTTVLGYKGTWTVTKIDADHFDLVGSTFSSAVVIGQANRVWIATRISAYAIDLNGSVYGAPGGGNTAMFTNGLLAGDRVFFSGGAQYPLLTEQFHTVQSVPQFDRFVVANVTYANLGTPTNEEIETIPIEVVTTFTENELVDIKFVQSADVLYILHPDHTTQKLVRLDDDGDRNDWLLADVDFRDGPYLNLNDLAPNVDTTTPANGAIYSDVYFEISSYAHTATAKVTGAVNFVAGDVGKYIEYKVGDQWKLALVTAQAGATATVTILDNVLLFLDSTTRLQRGGMPQPVVGSATSSPVYYGRSAEGQRRSALYNQQKVDPNDELSSDKAVGGGAIIAGTVKSQFSNTFASQDVGKYVRIRDSGRTAVGYWVQILSISSTSGGNSAAHGASLTMTANAATGKFIISAETRTGVIKPFRNGTAFSAFASTDVGRLIRLGFAGRWTWGKITTYTSATQVTLTFQEDMPRDPNNAAVIAGNQDVSLTTTGITYDWRMGAFSTTTGFPTVGVFHEQRLWLSGIVVRPDSIYGSVSGDFENFLPSELDSTVLDDNGVTVTLGSTKANAVKWMLSGPALTIGTSGGEWQMRANSSINEAITPANVKATEYTGNGSKAETLPARVGSAILFVDRSGEKVIKVFYSYEKDALDSDDLTVISEHILREHGGAVASAFQQKPHSIFWVACADGTLSAMTYNEKQEVVAWHHHTIQGGLVEDISVIPSEDASQDELWMVVKRTINGSTVRYIEVLEEDFYPTSVSSRLGMKFLDSHQYIQGFTGATITGLNHLEAQSVVVVKDGTRVAGTFTVTSGAITMSSGAVSEVLVGLLGNANLLSLPPEGGSPHGSAQGQKKRIVHLDTRFYNTDSVAFGPSSSSLITKTLPTNPNWFSGTDRLMPASGFDHEAPYYIRQAEPYPLNVLFIVSTLETNE